MSTWIIYKGHSFKRRYVWRDSNSLDPINVTGIVSMQLVLNKTKVLLELASNVAANSNGSVLTITNALVGQFNFVIKQLDTALLPRTVTGLLAIEGRLIYLDGLGDSKPLYTWNVTVN